MVDLKIPEIYFFPALQLPPFLKDPARPFAGVSMNMIGDLKGKLFYLVQDERKERLVEIMQNAAPGGGSKGVSLWTHGAGGAWQYPGGCISGVNSRLLQIEYLSYRSRVENRHDTSAP